MAELLGVVGLLLLIGFSIGLHELGHLLPAKRFGVKVTEYAIGFGPTVWRRQWGETDVRLRLLPVGGFIRMIGMIAPERADGRRVGGWFAEQIMAARQQALEEVPVGEDHRAFYRLSVPRRLVVMIGGPAMNLVLSFVLFLAVFSGIGPMQPSTAIGSVVPCVPTASDLMGEGTAAGCGVAGASPASAFDLKPGERLVSVAGRPINVWLDFSDVLTGYAGGDSIDIVLADEAGVERTVSIVLAERTVPVFDEAGEATGETVQRAFVGIGPLYTRQPIAAAEVPGMMWDMTVQSLAALGQFPEKLVALATTLATGGERDVNGPISVVGVTRLGGEVAASDSPITAKLFTIGAMAASLNLFLFLFNLLPLLPLDGGHAAGATYEGIRRWFAKRRHRPDPGPVDLARLLPLTYAVTTLLLLAGGLVIFADIVAPISFGS